MNRILWTAGALFLSSHIHAMIAGSFSHTFYVMLAVSAFHAWACVMLAYEAKAVVKAKSAERASEREHQEYLRRTDLHIEECKERTTRNASLTKKV